MSESELRPTADPAPRPPVVPGAPRSRVRAARRQALLEAAEDVFAERGFSRATMAEIAARAGYSAGNLYNVFAGKEALFSEVLTSRADTAETRSASCAIAALMAHAKRKATAAAASAA